MEPEPIRPLAPEVTVPVTFHTLLGARNPELRGRGFLHAGEGVFRFTGRGLGTFTRTPVEVCFTAAEIQNVLVLGRSVRFDMPRALALKKPKPFVFYCSTPADARAAAQLLPRNFDPDFVEGQVYHARLRRFSGSRLTVTNGIIALNVAVFVVMAGFLGAGWVDVPDIRPYILYGADNGAATTDGEWWRLVTSMFMHYGLTHLLFNMWALFQSGQLVERLLGRVLFALTYLACGLGGGLLSIYWHGDKMWSAGASGAIFGVYGAILGHFYREQHAIPKSVFQPIMKSTLFFAGYNLFYGMVDPTIDNSAHIGGFLTGVVLGWVTAMAPDPVQRARLWPRKVAQALGITALIVVVGVVKAPRFDYSPREELTWYKVAGDGSAGEAAITQRANVALARWEKAHDNGAALANLVDQEMVPFYQRFADQAAAVVLTPGRATDRKRQVVVQALRLKVKGLRHLSLAVRQNNSTELAAYVQAQNEYDRLLGTIEPVR